MLGDLVILTRYFFLLVEDLVLELLDLILQLVDTELKPFAPVIVLLTISGPSMRELFNTVLRVLL